MSLYNLLHGVDPASHVALAMLKLTKADVGRFRDTYFAKDEDGVVRIFVYTRNGGGNREHWDGWGADDATGTPGKPAGETCGCPGCVIGHRLPKHPQYVRDYDDDFDCTYATIVFGIPPEFADFPFDTVLASKTPAQAWADLFDKLSKGDVSDPKTQRAIEVGKQIAAEIEKALQKET